MKVLALTKYSERGPSSRYRFHQYLPFLREEGYEIEVRSFFSDLYLDNLFGGKASGKFYLVKQYLNRLSACLGSRRFDIVWIEGELFPYLPGWFEKALHRLMPGCRIYDFDDAVWLRYNKIPWLQKKYLQVLKEAAHVFAGNAYLCDYVGKVQTETSYLPTVVSGKKYTARNAKLQGKVIGWIGSPTTVYFLKNLKPAFDILKKKVPFELHVVGAVLDWPDIPIINKPWDDATELDHISTFDIGIMPLDDSAFAKGKCGLKLIQYMATGVPAVASPVGVNTSLIQESQGGFLAETTDEWVDHLTALLQSHTLKSRLGNQGKTWCMENLTVEVQFKTLLGGFKKAVDGRA